MATSKIQTMFEPETIRENVHKPAWWAATLGSFFFLFLIVLAVGQWFDFGIIGLGLLILLIIPLALLGGSALATAKIAIEPEWFHDMLINPKWLIMSAGCYLVLLLLVEAIAFFIVADYGETFTRWSLLLLVISIAALVALALKNPHAFGLHNDFSNVDMKAKSTRLVGVMYGLLLIGGLYVAAFKGSTVNSRTAAREREALQGASRAMNGAKGITPDQPTGPPTTLPKIPSKAP